MACQSRIKRCLPYLDATHAEHSRIPVKQSQSNNGNRNESQDQRGEAASREQPNYSEGKSMLEKLNAWLDRGLNECR